MLQYCKDYPSPPKSWRPPSYAEKIAKVQALHASPSVQSNASSKYNPCVLKFLDVAADVDFEIDLTDSQVRPCDCVGSSIFPSTSFVGTGLIYVDDKDISE